MANTCRTLSQLYSLFADNALKLITAQDGRDLAASAMGWTDSRAPGANDDNANTGGTGQYFDVGSTWIDFVGGDAWFCVDGSVGAAKWVKACCNHFPLGIQIPLANPADIGILLQGALLQTADLEQLKDNALNVLRRVSPRGKHVITPNDDIGLTLQLINNTTTFDQLQGLDSLGAQLWRFSYLGEMFASGFIYGITRISGNYTATRRDWLILADSTSGSLTVTLPASTSVPAGREIRVKKISSDAHTVSITRTAPDTLDGATTRSISTQYQGDGFIADGGSNLWRGIWSFIPIGTTFGTVSSVGLSLPASILTVSGSPVTTTGTLTATLANQAVATVFAGPASGSPAAPTFRALAVNDIPPAVSALVGVDVDYTTVAAAGAVSSVTLNIINPLPADFYPILTGSRIHIGNNFAGGAISNVGASIKIANQGPFAAGNWATTLLPAAYMEHPILAGNVYGGIPFSMQLTLVISGGVASDLTQGHATVFLVYGFIP